MFCSVCGHHWPAPPSPERELRAFIDAAVIPALIERFLREHAATHEGTIPPVRPAA
jgi:hypothetical protein